MSEQTQQAPAHAPVPQEQSARPPEPAVKVDTPVEARVYELIGSTNRAYCSDEESLALCIDLDKALQQSEKRVSDKHKAMTEGITASKSFIDGEKRKMVKAITDARAHIQKALIGPYREARAKAAQEEAERDRKEQEERALADAERLESEGKGEEAEQVLEEAGELAPGYVEQTGPVRGHTAGTASFTDFVNYEIEAPGEVPRELCSPDEKKIREALKDADPKAPPTIPGLRTFKDTRMTNR